MKKKRITKEDKKSTLFPVLIINHANEDKMFLIMRCFIIREVCQIATIYWIKSFEKAYLEWNTYEKENVCKYSTNLLSILMKHSILHSCDNYSLDYKRPYDPYYFVYQICKLEYRKITRRKNSGWLFCDREENRTKHTFEA